MNKLINFGVHSGSRVNEMHRKKVEHHTHARTRSFLGSSVRSSTGLQSQVHTVNERFMILQGGHGTQPASLFRIPLSSQLNLGADGNVIRSTHALSRHTRLQSFRSMRAKQSRHCRIRFRRCCL